MARPKKPILKSKVKITNPIGYIQSIYSDKIGEVIEIYDKGLTAIVLYNTTPHNTKVSVLLSNLKVV